MPYPEKNQQSYSKWIKIQGHPNFQNDVEDPDLSPVINKNNVEYLIKCIHAWRWKKARTHYCMEKLPSVQEF